MSLWALASLACLSPGQHVHSSPQQGDWCLPGVQGFSQFFHIMMTPSCSGRLIQCPTEDWNAWNGPPHLWVRKKRGEVLAPWPEPLLKSRPSRPLASSMKLLSKTGQWVSFREGCGISLIMLLCVNFLVSNRFPTSQVEARPLVGRSLRAWLSHQGI